jgi:hypothetical protein
MSGTSTNTYNTYNSPNRFNLYYPEYYPEHSLPIYSQTFRNWYNNRYDPEYHAISTSYIDKEKTNTGEILVSSNKNKGNSKSKNKNNVKSGDSLSIDQGASSNFAYLSIWVIILITALSASILTIAIIGLTKYYKKYKSNKSHLNNMSNIGYSNIGKSMHKSRRFV